PADLQLGGRSFKAAKVWGKLPQALLDRTCFFHHSTLTNNHGNLPKVLKVMGHTAKGEMMPSIIAKALAPCLGTLQVEPVSPGGSNQLTFEGRNLPNVPPASLRQ